MPQVHPKQKQKQKQTNKKQPHTTPIAVLSIFCPIKSVVLM